MKREQAHMNRMWWMASAVVLLFVATAVVPVAATDYVVPYPQNNKTFVPVANPDVRFDTSGYDNHHYYVNLTNTATDAGAKAIHIASTNSLFAGDITTKTNANSYSFYVSDTGGRGCQDDIILLVAVNKTSEDDPFSIHITAKGYNWTPTDDGYLPPWEEFEDRDQTTTVSATFTSGDFMQNSTQSVLQKWKFAPTANYPIYNGQDMATSKYFNVIAIDLNAGVIGNQSKVTGTMAPSYYANLTDFGMVNVTYTLEGITTGDIVAFNVYAYNNQTVQGQGINWFNKVLSSGTSGASGWKVAP
jgi:hypothetical protein